MTSQAETEKSTKMKLLYARELSTDEAINELCYIQRWKLKLTRWQNRGKKKHRLVAKKKNSSPV